MTNALYYIAYDKHCCAMNWIALLMISIVVQYIGIALLIIIIVVLCIGIALISIVVQCIEIALRMISIVVQCYRNELLELHCS